MGYYLVDSGYIPLDKSWTIRMGVLDLLSGSQKFYEDCMGFLASNHSAMNDDTMSLERALLAWKYGGIVDVDQSATLYRCLWMASLTLGLPRIFIMRGTLLDRFRKGMITDDPKIAGYTQRELLQLKERTSQWATAKVLLGDEERLEDAPYKLKLTYEAVSHWKQRRSEGGVWEPRHDKTILGQAESFLQRLHEGEMDFKPEQAEDYCFARAFGIITPEEGEARWPSLRGHESDRIEEMERALGSAEIDSRDHRVVQAVSMRRKADGYEAKVGHPEAVNKSWPQFWRFLEDSPQLAEDNL